MRSLTSSPSTTLAAKAAGLEEAPVEVAELQSAFTHEEPLLVEALGLGADVAVNPSGGPLAANPIMATGLARVAEAASQIRDNGKHRTLAHSTSGPCLQQNLVCILEGDDK
jgi:acetyl-CoA acetyltransferase